MGFLNDYTNVPDWEEKPEGYQASSMVKYKGNVFKADFWASKPGEGDPLKNGWRLYDELYDVSSKPSNKPARIIGYIPTWRREEGFDYRNPEMYRNITHGIISFLMFSETDLGEFDPTSVQAVKAVIGDVLITGHEQGTYISIALGGAVDYGFLYLMERIGSNPDDPVLQKAVDLVVDFVKAYHLDGVDLDLECWWDKNGDANNDLGGRLKSDGPHPAGKGLTLFAQRLRKAMPDKLISAALFASSWYGNCYDPDLVEHVDWLGLMTYDLTGSWNQSPVGPHTALKKIREQDRYIDEQQGAWPVNRLSSANTTAPQSDNPILSVEESLWYWTNPFFTNWQGEGQNLPRHKVAAGIPIYGYDFAYGKEPDDLSGQIAPGYRSVRYKDILSQFPDAASAADAHIKVPGNTPRPPFITVPGTYPYTHNIYFETPRTATEKIEFLKTVGVENVIIWELSNDVWEANQSIVQALYQNSGQPRSRPVLKTKLQEGSVVGDDNFGKADRYDKGKFPSVALNKANVVVEVHVSEAGGTLWYHVGRVKDDTIDWGTSVNYDEGTVPSVAMTNDGLVVEVHQSQAIRTVWYHVGRVKGDTIEWGGSIEYAKGNWPAVAMTNDGVVVEVHQDPYDQTLFYSVGRVERDLINWGESVKYDEGLYPAIAVNDDGIVVEMHQSSNDQILSYRVGRVEDDQVNWGKSIDFDAGMQPSIALSKGGLIVATFRSKTDDALWYSGVGQVAGDRITWSQGKSQRYGKGSTPRIASNGQTAVETHEEEKDKLSYTVLTLPAFRSTWQQVDGENSYCYCACDHSTNTKHRHVSSHTMKVKEGAPYLYAVLSTDVDSTDFPKGAILTIEGPNGVKYDDDVANDNQLVIMEGSSVRCLVVKDPKPGDWTMTMVVPAGLKFHCECNTVPSRDVYNTMIKALSKRNLIRDNATITGWEGAALVGIITGASVIATGGTVLLAGMMAAVAGGVVWTLTKGDAPKPTAEYMSFTARIRPLIEKVVTDLREKGFKEAIAFYYNLIGRNLSAQEWRVILTSQPQNAVSIVMVYAQVFKIIEHMTDAEEQNAVRHVLWQCLLKKRFGTELATQIGEAHEEARPGSEADNKADEINNLKGQQLANEVRSDLECYERAREMWEAGELQTRTDLEGDPN